MKPYIYSILFVFITSISFSQTKKIMLKESFNVDENTTLDLDLDNSDIHIIASEDDKIHFNYEITFHNYSERKINDLLDESVIKTTEKNNQIFLEAKNSKYLNLDIKYRFSFDFNNFDSPINDVYKDYIKNYSKTLKKREKLYITKDSLLEEINFSIGSDLDNYIKRDIDNYPLRKSLKTDKKIEKKFVIAVPKYIQFRIKAIESDIKCDFDLIKQFKMDSFKGAFKFKKINGSNNQITSSNGILETDGIRNTKIDLRDMSKVNIGSISNSNIKLESSKVQIGEIGENVIIKDFSSKLYLYNFNKNFTKFNLTGNYSELNFYKVVENNFSMDVFGHNTVLNMNENKTSFGVNKEEKLTKILQKKRKENVPFLGNIEVVLRNGILNIK